MTNEWRFQMRRKKRGGHCTRDWDLLGGLCGCGFREPVSKRAKTRIVKRELARQLRQMISIQS